MLSIPHATQTFNQYPLWEYDTEFAYLQWKTYSFGLRDSICQARIFVSIDATLSLESLCSLKSALGSGTDI